MDRVPRFRWHFSRSWAGRSLLLSSMVLVLTGCREKPPQVQQYTVKNLDRGKIKGVPKITKWRTLGAIALHKEEAWFFKISDEPTAVDALEGPLTDFLKTLKFDEAGVPSWQLAADWKELPGDQFRYRTIAIPVAGRDKPIDLTVSKLGFEAKDKDKFILDNVNRWRGQLALNNRDKDSLAQDLVAVPVADGSEAFLVNYLGNRQSTGMGGMGMGGAMPGGAGGGAVPNSNAAAASGGAGKLEYKAPESWTNKGASGMRRAAFDVAKGDQQAEVTVIDLTGDGGELLPNLNRWRGQVGLSAVSEEEMNKAAFEIAAGNKSWKSFRLEGKSKDGSPQAMLVATWKSSDRAWFIKMQGSVALLKEEEGRFIEFVKSFQVKP